jgi:1,4-dihydroxy-2-naphthoate polyprenyltransferase
MQSTNRLKIWLSTFRLRTLPLALASMFAGAFWAKVNHCFDLSIFIWSCVTTILLQILSNIANDYGDAQNGADTSDRLGPQRAVSSGLISQKAMKIAIVVFSILSVVAGITLLFLSFETINLEFITLFFIGIACIIAAIKYTAGKNPYGYRAMGDVSVFVFFGLVAITGSYLLYSKNLDFNTIPIAIAFGLLSAAVLNVNNIRDIETDIKANKITLAARLGKNKAILYQLIIISIAYILIFVETARFSSNSIFASIAIALIFIFIILKNLKLKTTQNAEKQTNILKITALTTFASSIILFFLQ